MQSSLGNFVAGKRIYRQGAVLVADVWEYPWGDLELLQDGGFFFEDGRRLRGDFRAGSIARPNTKLAKTTAKRKKPTTHAMIPGLYQAFRSSGHAVANYGAAGGIPHTEDAEIEEMLQAWHEYLLLISSLPPLLRHVVADADPGVRELIHSYRYKIDEHKQQAQRHMWRGIMTHDSLGRYNTRAQIYAIFGVGTELRKRQGKMRRISWYMDDRTACCLRLINEHMRLFDKIWQTICTGEALQTILSSQITGHSYAKVADLLKQVRGIRLRPFRGFAIHAERDLIELLHAFEKQQGVERITEITQRLREGTRWAFALNALQMIVFELSRVVHQLERQEKARRRKEKDTDPLRITFDMAPDDFADISKRIFTDPPGVQRADNEPDESFESRLGRIDDADVLRRPKKAGVLRHLEQLRLLVEAGDWIAVKDSLSDMADGI